MYHFNTSIMKKYILFLVFLYSIAGFAQSTSLECPQGFETTAFPPTGWKVFDNGVGTGQSWKKQGVTSTPNPIVYQGTKFIIADRENIGINNTSEDFIATPLVTIPENGELHFFARQLYNLNQGSKLDIRIAPFNAVQTNWLAYSSIFQAPLAPLTELQLNTTYDVYQENIIDLSAYAGQQVYIAIVRSYTQPTTSLGGDRIYIDNIKLVSKCLAPTNLTVSEYTPTTANLTWTNGGNAAQWEVEVIPSVSNPTGTGVIVNTNSYQAIGLTSGTSYKYYVRSVCTSCEANKSVWAGPFTFTPEPCNNILKTEVKIYNSTSVTIQFGTNSNYGSFEVAIVPLGSPAPTSGVVIQVPSDYTFTNLSPDTVYQVYYKHICAPNNVSSWTMGTTTQSFCNPANTQTFLVKSLFVNLINHLQSLTSVPNGYVCSQLTDLAPYITIPNPAIYNFSNVNEFGSTGGCRFSFSNIPASDMQDIGGLNQLHFFSPLTDINFCTYSSPEIFANVSTTGGTPLLMYDCNNIALGGTPSGNNGQDPNYTRNQIRHINFCPVTTPTIGECSQTFESDTFPPTGWAIFDNTPATDIDWIVSTTTPYQGVKSAYMARHFVGQGVTSKDYLVTPAITIPNNGNLKFYGKSVLNGNTGTIYNIEIKLASTGSQTDISGFTTIQVYDEISMSSNYTEHTIDLSAFSGQSIYIAFVRQHTQNGTGISGDHWEIDNVRVVEGCTSPTINLNSNALLTTYTSLNLTWTNPTSNLLQIEYGPTGYVPGTGTLLPSTASSPYQLTGLPAGSLLQFYYRFKCNSCEDLYSDWQLGGAYSTWNQSFCPSPQLTVTNISPTSATVSWIPYGPATQWELVMQPIYSGFPTSPGIIVTQSPYTFTNLDPNVIYQCYIRSVCSPSLNGFWESAIVYNFNQTPCTIGNPNTPIIKGLFIDFINKLHTDYLNGVAIDISYTSNEFTALMPYITDNNPAIYSFDGANFSFSFANHPGEINKDILIPFPVGGMSLVDFDCDFYNPEIYINDVSSTFSGDQQVNGKMYLKHIDFCKEIKPCNEVKGSIKIASSEICTNSPIMFVFNTDSNLLLNYSWTFTHIDTETVYTTNDYSPSVTLPSLGEYNVLLIVTDLLGCTTKFEYNFKIDRECTPCYKSNENSEYVKVKFIDLINYLNQFTTLPNGFNCTQLDELANYLTDTNPAIYNFSNELGFMKFSFANHPEYDVQIPISPSTLLTNVELGNYTMPEMYANIVTYLSNETISKKGFIKHINFCPEKICKSVKGNIEIKIDKLCTATELPFIFNTDYDASLLEYYWSFNYLDPQTQQYNTLFSTNSQESVQEPIVMLPYIGEYEVVLTIIDENECVTIIRKKFEIVDECKKCFEENPQIAENAKQAFINLINHLASALTSSINYGYTCSQLSDLSTYITDTAPAIYNFVNTGTSIMFSFADHGSNQYDVKIPITSGNPVSDIDLNDFVWEGIYANIKLFYSNGTAELGLVKHIDFCNDCKNFEGIIKIKNENQIVCQGISTDFVFESPYSMTTYNWSFYDASYNFIQSLSTPIASVLFQNNGTYHVSLEVTNKDNCKQTFYSTFVVATCPDTPIETDCKVHFNFNFKAPLITKGGILTTPERLNIANGVINFVNSRIGEQLYLTSYDDHYSGVRRAVTQQLMIAPYPSAYSNIGNEILGGCLRIQDDYYTNTFKKIITNNVSPSNLGIVPHPTISDINVSFFIISQDRYTSLAELQNAYNQLLSPNKADKIFFVLVDEGKFKDTSTNTLINPVDFVNSVKGLTAIDYNISGSFIDSDYIVYSKEQIADPSFVGQFSEFLNLAYKAIKPENCDISCTVNNPHTSQVKDMFRDLLIYLNTQSGTSVINGSTCPQLDLLRPYITDSNAMLYNFVKTTSSMSFSFANHPITEPDVFINLGTGDFGGIDLSNYVSSDTETLFKYNGNQTENNKVKHINFCPDELFCKHHVAIVVDESGSISETEAIKIRRQLKSFVEKQMKDNQQLGSNMHISLIGMSDSDFDVNNNIFYKRTDARIGYSRLLDKSLYDNWITNYKKRYNLPPAHQNYSEGVSASSDFWLSALKKAKELSPQPDIVIVITDGCETQDIDGSRLRDYIMQNFDNHNNSPVTNPHLFVVGIENGYYVDEELAGRPALTRETDPNYADIIDDTAGEETDSQSQRDNAVNAKTVSSTTENNSLTSETANRLTPFLKKSLKYLLGYTGNTEYPSIAENLKEPKFFNHDYIGLNDFRIFGSDGDPNYLSNGLIDKDSLGTTSISIGCGNILELSKCDECVGFQPIPEKEYILSAWVKEEQTIQVINYENAKIKLVFRNSADLPINVLGEVDEIECIPKGEIIDGWQRIFKKFRIPENTVFMKIHLINDSNGTPVYFDDIRIHPADGSMKSFVYDPETFKLMSEMDENNYSTFYEYDKEGGLIRVKKETERGVKTIQETRSGNVIRQ